MKIELYIDNADEVPVISAALLQIATMRAARYSIPVAPTAETDASPAAAPTVQPGPAKRTRRTKNAIQAEMQAASSPEEAVSVPEAAPTLFDAPEPVSEAPAAVDRATVVSAMREFATSDVKAAVALLERFGVKRVTDLPDERLGELYAALTA